jgi:hypothetical protein
VVVVALSVPAPEPMLQVTPALDESLATVAVNVCVAPWLSDAVAGLTLTVMAGGGGFCEPPPPPLPQPARIEVPQVRKQRARRIFSICNFGPPDTPGVSNLGEFRKSMPDGLSPSMPIFEFSIITFC